MITILSENDYVKDKIKNFDEKEKRAALFDFAKNFSIKILDNDPELLFKNNNSELHFNWHKVSEGSLLFDKALDLTLINVQKSLLTEIDNIAKSIDLENQRKIASLKVKLKSTLTINDLMNVKKRRYLLEQSKIAKELGIEKNRLNITSNVTISENAEPQRYNQEFNVKDSYYPYYLRGFKAINKEIELIENRSENENKLMSEGYLALKHALILVEKDNRSKYLREAMKTLENDNISKWVSFNFELAEVQNIKNTHLHILLSIILGGILGMFYVLLIKAFKNRKAY